MGMFDEINCEYPLPMPEDPKGYTGSKNFQTKDLNCCMNLYEIDKDGNLFRHDVKYEREEGNPKSKSILERIGRLKEISSELVREKITDLINFYDYQQTDGNYDYYIEYQALFRDGTTSEIKLLSFEAKDNSGRKKRDEEFFQKMKEHHAFTKTLKYKLVYKPYDKLLFFVFGNLRRFANKLLEFLAWFERKISL
jgi:hypothetical protein